MSVAKNLRLLRRIRGLTLEELSEQVGISVSYLSRIESGNRRVTEPLLFKLSELLNCDPTEILSDEPPEKQIASLGFSSLSFHRKTPPEKVSELMELLEKVAGQLQDNTYIHKLPIFTSHYFKNTTFPNQETTKTESLDGIPLNEPSDWLPCPPELTQVKNAFAYYVVNDEMSPRYSPGDVVFINPQKPLMPGCFALLVKNDDTIHLRQFINSNGQTFTFKSYHDSKEENLSVSDIKGIYRIVGSREFA
ncbi:MAG: helix-turn-helix domain-containing protein [Candidatus Paracaedibacteraceae bacterium]|nr:helix-turn-helix domain-containing protein [Candidatus Paracaedibacteraceae bacterium]